MKTKKTFDAVRWMRQRREQIDEEDRGLTWEQKRRKTHEIISRDPLLREFRAEIRTPDQVPSTVMREPSPGYGEGEGDRET